MESNEIEVFHSNKTYYYIIFGFLAIVFIVMTVSFSTLPPEMIIIGLSVMLICAVIFIPAGIIGYRRNVWIRFVISDESIKVIKPRKTLFDIAWSEFDVIKLKILWRDLGSLKPRKMQRKSNIFKIKFLIEGIREPLKEAKFNLRNRSKAGQIADLIHEYANKLGKKVIYKQRGHKP